jgi:hypothetical protein
MDKIIEYAKNPPSLNITQIFGKKSTSGTPVTPIKVAATPAAAPATKGGGNFNLLKELKKLHK